MTFATSVSPDITEDLPTPLSTVETAATTAGRSRIRWDLTVDGLGFNLAVNDAHPYVRESASTQKQQTDVSAEAGEQTLDGYWIRSQTSWHLGAGVNFYEPGAREGGAPTQYRFKDCVGVDVWTEGDLTLLKATTNHHPAGSANVFVGGARNLGADYWFVQEGGVLTRYTDAGVGTAYTNGTFTAGVTRPETAGAKVLVGNGFGIASGPITGSALTMLYTQTTSDTVVPYWAKGRLIATSGRDVFELALDGSSGTTAGNLDTVTPIFTHPDTGWTWTGVAETPTSILVSGYSGSGRGCIYSFTLETAGTGTTPTLGQPFQVAEFPPGEEVHSIFAYLGTYLGIGTSHGVRVGVLGDRGSVQYGPLLFRTTAPVKALTARESFLYAGVTDAIDGKSGVARVNLGATIGDSLIFPWAWDAQTHANGTVTSVGFVGNTDRVVAAVASVGAFVQSATAYEPTGTLTSGAVRYGTTEAKAFRRLDVLADTGPGVSVVAQVVNAGGAVLSIATLTDGASGRDLSLAQVAQQEFVSYRLKLTGGTDTPTVRSVALKAVPSVRKQRLIQYPINLTAAQTDSSRAPLWRDVGSVLAQLEEMESEKAVVTVVDYRLDERFPAVIETVQFRASTPTSTRPRAGNNAGGMLALTVRRVD